LGEYVTIVEKIIVEQEEIPFETIIKDISDEGEETDDRVLQEGENGIREVKYKVKYQNDVEIERTEISSEVIQEPVDRIVQISTKVSSRYGDRSIAANASNYLAASVADIEPIVLTMNASAYTASTCGKSESDPGYGVTSSGNYAIANYTLAAGSAYPIGTVMYIPYFADDINGGWFVVQDRGGAISNNRIDIYMDTYEDCILFGRRNIEMLLMYMLLEIHS
jgi:3D (Asp-Asp-Asp) domain-containing protein